MIIDAHTHCQVREDAVINSSFSRFKPVLGRFYSVGIHPWDIKGNDVDKALKAIETHINNKQIVAIGECGIDALIDTPIDIQIKVFERQVELSERFKKPLIVHCVRSSNTIMAVHRKYNPSMPWIIHGFRSNENVLKSFLSGNNIFISIGEKFNEKTLKFIPDNLLLIETDESILSIEEIVGRIAKIRNQSPQYILELAVKNIKTALLSE